MSICWCEHNSTEHSDDDRKCNHDTCKCDRFGNIKCYCGHHEDTHEDAGQGKCYERLLCNCTNFSGAPTEHDIDNVLKAMGKPVLKDGNYKALDILKNWIEYYRKHALDGRANIPAKAQEAVKEYVGRTSNAQIMKWQAEFTDREHNAITHEVYTYNEILSLVNLLSVIMK